MNGIKKTGLLMVIIGGLLVGCEDDTSDSKVQLPLAGAYTLTEMTVNVEAATLRDTLLAFAAPQNGVTSISIDAGTLVLVSSTLYTDGDPSPIGGTVTLNNDESASLAGSLPVNWGTGCEPSVLISALSSDGQWIADTTTGTFAIDLVVDQLDIDGTFSLSGDELEIRYFSIEELDERSITSVSYLGAATEIVPTCLPVRSVTERIMKLTLNP